MIRGGGMWLRLAPLIPPHPCPSPPGRGRRPRGGGRGEGGGGAHGYGLDPSVSSADSSPYEGEPKRTGLRLAARLNVRRSCKPFWGGRVEPLSRLRRQLPIETGSLFSARRGWGVIWGWRGGSRGLSRRSSSGGGRGRCICRWRRGLPGRPLLGPCRFRRSGR